MLVRQQQIDRYEKEQKAQKRKQNLSLAVSIGAGLAIIASVVMTALMMRKGGGMGAADGAGSAAEELKQITDVPLNWTKFTEKNKVAPLDSDTTAQSVKDTLGNLAKRAGKLTPKKKAWTKYRDRTRIMYVFGESGTGKSYCGQQYAQETGAYCTTIRYGEIGSPFKDAGPMRRYNVFKNIKTTANANPGEKYVVIVDEGDSLVRKLSGVGSSEESAAREAVLTGFDELTKECNNVTVIITSNYHPEHPMIDKASMRRITMKVEVPTADRKQADALCKLYLKGMDGLKPEFFESPEYKKFVDDLVAERYGSGEIASICSNASDIFTDRILNIPDNEIEKFPLIIEDLLKGKKLQGAPAARNSDTMLHP